MTHGAKVYLVGVGPGDPELLTLKAHRLIGSADEIFVDRLVSQEIRDLFSPDAIVHEVGKAKGSHRVHQTDINQQLIASAAPGKTTCRVKGGDPFVFGRGGEEMLALLDAGVSVEVVPGITAALGCAASAGIPITHRGVARAVTLITGHTSEDMPFLDAALFSANHTLVFYMGLTQVGRIQRELLRRGRPAETPIAIVEHGTTDRQRVVRGELGELSRLVTLHRIGSPALLIIGDVSALTDIVPSRPAWLEELSA
ncbi:MAG: uroporphyrinogen-III C-methyltransferase [Pseudomonadota bacterium]